MLLKLISSTLFLILLFIHSCFAIDKADGWTKSGRKSGSYEMGLEKHSGRNGTNCGTIKSIDPRIEGYGIYIQKFEASHYCGKKVMLSGYMKSLDVAEQASFMLRVDKVDSTAFLDNMHDREIKGSTDWKLYEIMLEVPENATYITIGASLKGIGQIWFDDLSFQIVENSKTFQPELNCGPINLSFEKISD